MPDYRETDKYISSFSELPDGWHFGSGTSPTMTNLNIMRDVLRSASDLGFQTFEAFPGVDGEVQLAIYDGVHFYAITLEADNLFTVLCELNGQQELFEERVTYYDVLSRLEEFAFKLCNTSESYIQAKSPRSTEGPAISPLRTHPMALEYPASRSIAPLPKADQSASTSQFITGRLLAAIRSSSGLYRILPC